MKNKLYTLIFLVSFFNCYSQIQKLGITPTIVTPPTCETYVYIDNDLDGFGAGARVCLDTLPEGIPYSLVGTDCNDNNAQINPNTVWFVDADSDSFGSAIATPFVGCYPTPQTGYTLNNLDCNDGNLLINPNTKWYVDADLDGFGDNNVPYIVQCNQPPNRVLDNTDCNDSTNLIKGPKTWYQDTDQDSFGDPAATIIACTAPVNYVANNLDACPTISGPIQGCITPNPTTSYGTRNYIITTTPKIPVTNIQNITNSKDAVINITYYDELGKPNQNIASQQSASGNNIVTHIEYDSYSRQVKDYLPYKANAQGIAFETSALSSTLSYSDYTSQNPYNDKLFESSPLNRVLKQAAPGSSNDWAMGGNHEMKFDYQTNTASEVKLYVANATWNLTAGLFDMSLLQAGTTNYTASQLTKTIIKDENWTNGNNNTTEEFKDKEGKVILKRAYDNNVAHDTYYVYDQYSNLTYVIPPLVNDVTTQLDGLCYQYKYDLRNRIVEKKLPGKQWEFIVYDKLDRVVATGPAFTPFPNATGSGWMITKYDVFNRPILTAWQTATISSTTRTSLQTSYNNATVLNETKNATATDSAPVNSIACRYSNLVIPTSGYDILTVNYYDDYNFSFAPVSIPTLVETQPVYYNTTVKPKGLLTGSWVRVLDATNTSTSSEKSYILYDYKARPIRNYKSNYLGGFVQIDENVESITGRKNYTLTTHSRASLSTGIVTIRDEYTYSNQDRLLIQTQQINTLPKQLIVSNTYDELGKLISKKVGGTDITGLTGLQKVDYSYNIRNWLTEINKTGNLAQGGTDPLDLFAFKINYNTVQNEIGYTGTPLYNGNIAETYWKTSSDNILRKYVYFYDNLNRLKNAIYQKPGNAIPVPNFYNENLTYDKNGNIMTLIRNSANLDTAPLINIDNLSYSYLANSNQLIKVDDNPTPNNPNGFKDGLSAATEYFYDANGNMTKDDNKGITSITYNHLNLPVVITFATGNIKYLYNAVGQKVKKIVMITAPSLLTNTTDYIDSFQYLNNILQFFPTSEGYVTGTYKYVFQYKDHLGNVRLSYTKNTITGNLDIIEENHYYPFGLKHAGYNPNILSGYEEAQKYKYQGQERQDELELNWDSFKYRNYDMAIGRFMSIDPLAEKYPYNSTFAFQENKMGMGRELEGLELGGAQFNNYAAEFGKAVTGFIDNIRAEFSRTDEQEIIPNIVTLEKSSTTTYSSNLSNYAMTSQYPNFGSANLINKPTTENKTELKATAKAKVIVEGVTLTASHTVSKNIKTGDKESESKVVVGAGENGIYVSKKTSSTGESKTRTGVQGEVAIPITTKTKVKFGASISIGQ
ncbi:DUF6443 domain-containing protein [Flavobacterium sp.]|uniref:DUF6443 domain-containing protein n=1 Tax=Flavobacterium sp. TaxID=239 RepID=UPI0038FC3383